MIAGHKHVFGGHAGSATKLLIHSLKGPKVILRIWQDVFKIYCGCVVRTVYYKDEAEKGLKINYRHKLHYRARMPGGL